MALNTFKRNCLTPLHFKGLRRLVVGDLSYVVCKVDVYHNHVIRVYVCLYRTIWRRRRSVFNEGTPFYFLFFSFLSFFFLFHFSMHNLLRKQARSD